MINLSKETRRKRRLIREGKQKIDHDVRTELIFTISRVFTADDDKDVLKLNYGFNRYMVMAWTDETEEYITRVVRGFTNQYVMFNEELVIPLDSPRRYLYIELARGFSSREPSTSTNIVVKGRAKIRLPPLNSNFGEISGVVDLVGLDSDRSCVVIGALKYSMRLHRFVVL
ncbi:hypothetical protein CARUB_v10007470mg [Capsella rubella]|uniref:Uncharacterized protein n=1 Tax=Capsella rubella TaxID=81985 RepID=R0H5L6_9BRAS|nr:uncharacterized protein LOC17880634 [Capsella rubella]EOA18848.1 hypothetical protein CARUB_v10007470mg [Capsella rubella]